MWDAGATSSAGINRCVPRASAGTTSDHTHGEYSPAHWGALGSTGLSHKSLDPAWRCVEGQGCSSKPLVQKPRCCIAAGKIPANAKSSSAGTSRFLSWVQQLPGEKQNGHQQRRSKRVRDVQGKNKQRDGSSGLEGTEKTCRDPKGCTGKEKIDVKVWERKQR